jgi:hypothetical protein
MTYYYYTLQKRHHEDMMGIQRNPYADDAEIYRTAAPPQEPQSTGTPQLHPQDERAPKHVARMDSEAGRKFDQGKLDYTLLPWDALTEVVKVLQHGVEKYARDNWLYVPNALERYEAAGMRHRIARLQGEEMDPESGYSHLAHEACCLLFQLALKARAGQ